MGCTHTASGLSGGATAELKMGGPEAFPVRPACSGGGLLYPTPLYPKEQNGRNDNLDQC